MKRLVRVELAGFDLPITAIVFLLSENCSRTLREFSFQDLEAQGREIDPSVYRGLSACKKLKVLDFRGLPVTTVCLDYAHNWPELEYLGMTFDNPELIGGYLKQKSDYKLPIKKLLLTDSLKPEMKDLSAALINVDDVTLVSTSKQDLKWLQYFKKLRHLSVDFRSPTQSTVFDTLLRKAGKKLRTLRSR
jgi:hypothetical protein